MAHLAIIPLMDSDATLICGPDHFDPAARADVDDMLQALYVYCHSVRTVVAAWTQRSASDDSAELEELYGIAIPDQPGEIAILFGAHVNLYGRAGIDLVRRKQGKWSRSRIWSDKVIPVCIRYVTIGSLEVSFMHTELCRVLESKIVTVFSKGSDSMAPDHDDKVANSSTVNVIQDGDSSISAMAESGPRLIGQYDSPAFLETETNWWYGDADEADDYDRWMDALSALTGEDRWSLRSKLERAVDVR